MQHLIPSLAGHFRNEHYLCDHELCLEAKFVVFMSESDLKKHRLTDHSEPMSRNERRAALNIPINVTVGSTESCASLVSA